MANKQKEQIVENITESIKESKCSIIFDYRGLTVESITALRSNFYKNDIKMKIYKNTLARIAMKNLKYNLPEDWLIGPSCFIFSKEQIIEPAKILTEFIKETEIGELKGGIVEGKLFDKKQLISLSNMSTVREMQTKLVFTLNSPILSLVRNLNYPMSALTRVLKQISDNKGEAA